MALNRWIIFLTAFLYAVFASLSFAMPAPAMEPTLILVDKAKNELKVAHYSKEEYKVIKTYRTIFGQVLGDKMDEGDLKTPEGVYFFTSRLRPPSIKPKFGSLALYMDYPNTFDRLAGRTGFDIMLHATDDPSRLSRDLDSEGCVVVKNEEIEEIQKYVRLGLTPILIFDELKPNYMKPSTHAELIQFFDQWVSAWEGKNIDPYVDSYHSLFRSGGRNLAAYRVYKNGLNRKYATIDVGARNIKYYPHPKYSIIQFEQNYRSTLKGGTPGYRSSGTKTLYVAKEDGKLKIIDETFTPRKW